MTRLKYSLLVLWTLIGTISAYAELKIYPADFANFNASSMLRWPPNQTLRLTCELRSPLADQYALVWYLPHDKSRPTNITTQNGKTSLVLKNPSETDNGPYICKAEKKGNKAVASIKAKTITVTIGDHLCENGWFKCQNSEKLCIPERFKCDGYKDCPDGSDETVQYCGLNVCEGKLRCGEKERCLDPEFCCDPELDSNCPVLMDCCKPFIEQNRYYYQLGIERSGKFHRSKENSHLVVVIGCAVAFTCVFCVVIILMCQFPTEKPWLRPPNFLARGRWPRPAQPHNLPVTMEDLDVYFESLRNVSCARNEDPIPPLPLPPPYILAAEPPPPYPESPEPVGVAEIENNNEDNNNGDINGNSDLRDQHTERVVAVLRPISPRMANRRLLRGGSSLVALNQAPPPQVHMRESRSYAALISPTRFASHQQRLMYHQDSESDSD